MRETGGRAGVKGTVRRICLAAAVLALALALPRGAAAAEGRRIKFAVWMEPVGEAWVYPGDSITVRIMVRALGEGQAYRLSACGFVLAESPGLTLEALELSPALLAGGSGKCEGPKLVYSCSGLQVPQEGLLLAEAVYRAEEAEEGRRARLGFAPGLELTAITDLTSTAGEPVGMEAEIRSPVEIRDGEICLAFPGEGQRSAVAAAFDGDRRMVSYTWKSCGEKRWTLALPAGDWDRVKVMVLDQDGRPLRGAVEFPASAEKAS